jgi:hypothetical protein
LGLSYFISGCTFRLGDMPVASPVLVAGSPVFTAWLAGRSLRTASAGLL